MTQRDKKRVKIGLLALLIVWLILRFTKTKKVTEVLKDEGKSASKSALPLDTNKYKADVDYTKIFGVGGAAAAQSDSFNHKVDDMMNSERKKGKIPIKSEVIKEVQKAEREGVDVAESPKEADKESEHCFECEEKKRQEQEERKRQAQAEMVKKVVEKSAVESPVMAVVEGARVNTNPTILPSNSINDREEQERRFNAGYRLHETRPGGMADYDASRR